MADHYYPGLMEWFDFWDSWHEWSSQKPSLKHPIKYLKWYRSEPKYETFIKENNK